MADQLGNDRSFRTLNVLDDFTLVLRLQFETLTLYLLICLLRLM